MQKIVRRISSAHVIALLALFVAVGGTAGASIDRLLTGDDVKNGTLTGSDIRNRSLTGLDLKRDSITASRLRANSVRGSEVLDGSLGTADLSAAALEQLLGVGASGGKGEPGAQGPDGPAGQRGPQGTQGAPATLPSVNATAPSITNYSDGSPIVTANALGAGYYLAIATATVTNTGASDDYLGCGFDVAGSISSAAGFSTTAGNTVTGSSVTAVPISQANDPITFLCFGSGSTTFDIAGIKMKLVKLADQ